MLRREARLRREYLYRKAREEAQRSAQERKDKVRRALEENRLIPTELRREALALQGSLEFDDAGGEGVTSHMDDEYRWAGVEDPKIMITTSRDPSSRLKMFAKELKLVFPGAQRMNRGTPVGLIVSHLPFGPTAYFTLCNVVMRHDIPDLGTMSEAKPHLITHGFTSRLGKRVSDILRYLFPVPKDDSHRVITFANQDDYISFRHHVYKKTDHRNVELTEVGPRFELKLYMIRLGTLEQEATADVEWRWHPYTNTARKRVFLSADLPASEWGGRAGPFTAVYWLQPSLWRAAASGSLALLQMTGRTCVRTTLPVPIHCPRTMGLFCILAIRSRAALSLG
uniref:IMP U3 small nucleolar ribonucleoprotein 4 n=1 Tax=Oryctolagus cuniculus TaxID=9986 RepID=A0A5F9DVV9_RABIT